MTTGIYQLTFSSGARYIGKSVDIPARWKQHSTAFGKGKAAGPMQFEFNKCGAPDGTVLFECHSDHLDIVEALCISRFNPELNTSRPKDPFPGNDEIEDILVQLTIGTLDHVKEIFSLSDKNLKASSRIKQLEEEVNNLKVARSQREINVEKDKKIYALRGEVGELKSYTKELEFAVAYHKQPWWKKLF